MRVLLIAPDFDPDSRLERNSGFANHHTSAVAPLGLATVAALAPPDVEVDIWDEAVRPPVTGLTVFAKPYDLVGVTGYDAHIRRVRELGRLVREKGLATAVGGPGVSAAPEQYRDSFDILFIGEAEHTWPQFLADWKRGNYRTEYRQVTRIDMACSPVPNWELIHAYLGQYRTAAIQTTRGCPFDCEFCNVTYLFGRTARHKSVAQVLDEVRQLESLGASKILFCDDNFIGNPAYARHLLKALIELNATFRYPMQFFTNVTLNVAKNRETLGLLAEANFTGVYIGIESPNVESLIEMNKPQNYRTDMVADIRTIQSYGLPIEAGMVVGFDHDDISIFDRQVELLERAGIAAGTINMLNAPTGTKLWSRLNQEGRVLEVADSDGCSEGFSLASVRTNIVPKLMTRSELLCGYRDLLTRLRSWASFEVRVKGMVAQVSEQTGILRRLASQRRREKWKTRLTIAVEVLRSTGWGGRAATLRILLYTSRKAPFMLHRVTGLIRRHTHQVTALAALVASIGSEIQRESGAKPGWRVQQCAVVPEQLRRVYKDTFASVYESVAGGLDDRSREHELLVRIAYEFFAGSDGASSKDSLRASLLQIANRLSTRNGCSTPSTSVAGVPVNRPLSRTEEIEAARAAARNRSLADDVIREAEKDLRRLAPISRTKFVVLPSTPSHSSCDLKTGS